MSTSRIFLLCFIALTMAAPVAAQNVEGLIDFDESIQQQIDQLEARLDSGRDAPARRQTIMLKWLIELYEMAGQYEHIALCYQRILVFYPYDVSSLNAYARFYLDRAHNIDVAEKLLAEAAQYAELTDVRSLDRGTTLALLARLHNARDNHERAIDYGRRAVELLGDEQAGDALRILGDSQRQAGHFDDAGATYLTLIGRERGSNREDINSLQLFLHETTRYKEGSSAELIDEAITAADSSKRARIEHEGAEVVVLTTEDGVRLEGTWRRGQNEGAVLFIPDVGHTRTGYAPYAQLLFSEGFSTLSLDLRGHGDSRADSLLSVAVLSPDHFRRLPDDIVTGFRYLRDRLGVSDDQIVVVSAGMGCALVEKALHAGGLAPAVTHLSPDFSAEDRDLRSAVSFHADRPILVMYSTEDIKATRSFRTYRSIKPMPQLTGKSLSDAGHGLETLRRDPQALEYFQEWIAGTLSRSE